MMALIPFLTTWPTLVLSITMRTAAYLDPGSGSFLIQLLIGGIVGLFFLLKTYWRQFKGFVLRVLGRTPQVSATDGDESAQDAS